MVYVWLQKPKRRLPVVDPVDPDTVPSKKSKKPMLIGLVLAVLLGGVGFYATWSGLILGAGGDHPEVAAGAEALPDIAFVPIEPLVVSIGPLADKRYLRFASQLEVTAPQMADVTLLLPRVVDVLNGYLRAVDPAQFDDPTAMIKMRAQMLRRIQIVTGDGRVRDLLITEFVLN